MDVSGSDSHFIEAEDGRCINEKNVVYKEVFASIVSGDASLLCALCIHSRPKKYTPLLTGNPDNNCFFMRLNSLFAPCAGTQDVDAAISCHNWQRSQQESQLYMSMSLESGPSMPLNFCKLPLTKQCIKY